MISRALVPIVGLMVVAQSATAQETQERRPIREESLTPMVIRPASTASAPAASDMSSIRTRPFLTPFGPMNSDEVLRIKRQSASGQFQTADEQIPVAAPTTQAADVTAQFRGINIGEATVNGFGFVPPDPNVAAGPNQVVHVVNLAIRLLTRTGAQIQTRTLNDFFGTPVAENGVSNLSDPTVIFDANASNRRFYIAAIESNVVSGTGSNFSRIHLAVSRSPTPGTLGAKNWCFYRINAVLNQGTQLANWADFPSVGVGEDALVITTNQFTFRDFGFVTAAIRAIRKVPLANNAASCPTPRVFTFRASDQVGDPGAFTVQPVQHLTSPSSFAGTGKPVYLINSILTAATSVPSKDYRVYRLRNVAGSPTLSRTTVTGNYAYYVPPNVGQDNDAGLISTNDERVEEAAGVGDAFWATHATACSFPSGNVSCVRVVRIRVGQTSAGSLRAMISQQKTFGDAGSFLFEPGLAVNRDETVAVPFHFASPDQTDNNLSTWWVTKDRDETSYRPLRVLATGSCQQVVTRTGDYSGAETDPVDLKSFWLAGEAAREISAFGGACLWTTRIIRVTPSGSTAQIAAGGASGE